MTPRRHATARERAERELDGSATYSDSPAAVAVAVDRTGRRVAWALLDVADAIREHADAVRAAAEPPIEIEVSDDAAA